MGLEYEMTFAERIEGPLGPTTGSPARLCWKIAEAALTGPRITASLAVPGTDWIRIEPDGTHRPTSHADLEVYAPLLERCRHVPWLLEAELVA